MIGEAAIVANFAGTDNAIGNGFGVFFLFSFITFFAGGMDACKSFMVVLILNRSWLTYDSLISVLVCGSLGLGPKFHNDHFIEGLSTDFRQRLPFRNLSHMDESPGCLFLHSGSVHNDAIVHRFRVCCLCRGWMEILSWYASFFLTHYLKIQ